MGRPANIMIWLVAVTLGGLEHVHTELNIIREAVAPGVPNPPEGTDTDSAAREH